MGYLDFGYEKHHLKRIKKALKIRGLFMDETDEWEIHGPHLEMDFQVYIGHAYEKKKENSVELHLLKNEKDIAEHYYRFYVAIYPRGVYSIGVSNKWWDISPECKIMVK